MASVNAVFVDHPSNRLTAVKGSAILAGSFTGMFLNHQLAYYQSLMIYYFRGLLTAH
jgi:hypothetical protein